MKKERTEPMKRIILLTILFLAFVSASQAQGSNDYHKWDIYGGYSLNRIESNLSQASLPRAAAPRPLPICAARPPGSRLVRTRRNFSAPAGTPTALRAR